MNDELQDLILTMEERVNEFSYYIYTHELPPRSYWEGKLSEAQYVLEILKEMIK